jgi:hypothetical protein
VSFVSQIVYNLDFGPADGFIETCILPNCRVCLQILDVAMCYYYNCEVISPFIQFVKDTVDSGSRELVLEQVISLKRTPLMYSFSVLE